MTDQERNLRIVLVSSVKMSAHCVVSVKKANSMLVILGKLGVKMCISGKNCVPKYIY